MAHTPPDTSSLNPDIPDRDRYSPLDLLRGLIVIVMAIDHASYFVAKVHQGEFWGLPLPSYGSAAAFLTRAVTHIAAPGFFFLMGASIVLLASARRGAGWSDRRIFRFLLVRGLLLVVLQHLVENPAWLLGTLGTRQVEVVVPGGGSEVMLHFGVLYGLGVAMIACAALLRAPAALLAIVGVCAIVLEQFLVPGPGQSGTLFSPLSRLLFVPGHTNGWQVFYPALPWFGVTALGMAFARAAQRAPARAFGRAWMLGLACLAGFVAIRTAGGFGNLHPIEAPGWIGFLNVTKYPPSLAFLLLTMGVNLVLLSILGAAGARLRGARSPLMVFGKSALLFYLLHLYVYALIGLAFPVGVSMAAMYAAWLVGLVVLYPVCERYAGFKARTAPGSLWRLL